MRNHKNIFFALFILLFIDFFAFQRIPEPWNKWLNEVDLIMTKAERSVFVILQTEEDRKRFQESFWKIRDPDPETPQNEFKMEFNKRFQYTKTNLEGEKSDRGRIYILLGKPLEINNYSGFDSVIDCELWNYKSEGRPGLPPYMNFIFFRKEGFGEYKLFSPGLNSALDILSPGNRSGIYSELQAYNVLRSEFPELADATLSIIPGESEAGFRSPLSSSSSVITQIYTLPEREINKNYLKNFSAVEGIVDVTYSSKEMGGKGDISISENRGIRFLNYSLMPERIQTSKYAENLNIAKITINLRIEDLNGMTIFQQEREIDLKIDDSKKKVMLEENEVTFRDFAPLINGKFNVIITFSNKTSEEFFIYRDKIDLDDTTVPVIVGYHIKEDNSESFMPFQIERYRALLDPRNIYNKSDSLEGVLVSTKIPRIFLREIENEKNAIELSDIVRDEHCYLFKQPLQALKASNYYLLIEDDSGILFKKIISVMPFQVKKTIDFDRSEMATSVHNYTIALAQQYLNSGEADKALENITKLPEVTWKSQTLPLIARAYFMKKDYERVIELLENNVVKDYSMLLLLGNAQIELKKYKEAAESFEMLRRYGDTAWLNKNLGDIYKVLGDEEKAKVYWERAQTLEKNPDKIN